MQGVREMSLFTRMYSATKMPTFGEVPLKEGGARDLKYGMDVVVKQLATLESGRVAVTGPPGVGKTTVFPFELARATGRCVVVVSPNQCLAAQSHKSAVSMGNRGNYWSGVEVLDRTGPEEVAYMGSDRFLGLVTDGTFRKGVIFVVDECLTNDAVVLAALKFANKLAYAHLVIEISTSIGKNDKLPRGINVQLINGTARELAEASAGKSILRFCKDYGEALALQKIRKGPILCRTAMYEEYEAAYKAAKEQGIVYATVEIATGLTLPVQCVVSVSKRLSIVVNEAGVEAMHTPTTQLENYQQATRVARIEQTGTVVAEVSPELKGDTKTMVSPGEKAIARFIERSFSGKEPDDDFQKQLTELFRDAKTFMRLVIQSKEWRLYLAADVALALSGIGESDLLKVDVKSIKPERMDEKRFEAVKPRTTVTPVTSLTVARPRPQVTKTVESREHGIISFQFTAMALFEGDYEPLVDDGIDERLLYCWKDPSYYARVIGTPKGVDAALKNLVGYRNGLISKFSANSDLMDQASINALGTSLSAVTQAFRKLTRDTGQDLGPIVYRVGSQEMKDAGSYLYPYFERNAWKVK